MYDTVLFGFLAVWNTLRAACGKMSCERAGDAILDELGLTLRSSKAQVGKKFPKKRADVQ